MRQAERYRESKNLGSPVPSSCRWGQLQRAKCWNLHGTPVIDPETQTLYVIAFVYVNGTPTYQVHALDLSTFADKGNSPLTVSPPTAPLISQLLTDGTTFTFSTGVEQQRAGLVLFF